MTFTEEELEKLKKRVYETYQGRRPEDIFREFTQGGSFDEPFIARPIAPSGAGLTQDEERYKMSLRIAHLESELRRTKGRIQELLAQHQEDKRRLHAYMYGARPQPGKTPEWIKDHLKFLIFACHPDRNSGREEAQEVTKELLKLR